MNKIYVYFTTGISECSLIHLKKGGGQVLFISDEYKDIGFKFLKYGILILKSN